jgi:tryptophan-rich sensory protein
MILIVYYLIGCCFVDTGGLRWALTERLMDFLGSKMNSIMTIYTISPAAAITLVPFALWLEVSLLSCICCWRGHFWFKLGD